MATRAVMHATGSYVCDLMDVSHFTYCTWGLPSINAFVHSLYITL